LILEKIAISMSILKIVTALIVTADH